MRALMCAGHRLKRTCTAEKPRTPPFHTTTYRAIPCRPNVRVLSAQGAVRPCASTPPPLPRAAKRTLVTCHAAGVPLTLHALSAATTQPHCPAARKSGVAGGRPTTPPTPHTPTLRGVHTEGKRCPRTWRLHDLRTACADSEQPMTAHGGRLVCDNSGVEQPRTQCAKRTHPKCHAHHCTLHDCRHHHHTHHLHALHVWLTSGDMHTPQDARGASGVDRWGPTKQGRRWQHTLPQLHQHARVCIDLPCCTARVPRGAAGHEQCWHERQAHTLDDDDDESGCSSAACCHACAQSSTVRAHAAHARVSTAPHTHTQ
jgi:hypothetical protein